MMNLKYRLREFLLVALTATVLMFGVAIAIEVAAGHWPQQCIPPRVGALIICIALLIQGRQIARPEELKHVKFGVMSLRDYLTMFSGVAAIYGTALAGFGDLGNWTVIGIASIGACTP